MRGAVPARGGDQAGGELPLDAAGARAGEPARPEARRRGEGAASGPLPDGPEPEVRPFPTAGGGGGVPRRADPRRRLSARGDRAPLPDARAARRLRGGARTRRASRPRARRCSTRDAARRLLRLLDPSRTRPTRCARSRASRAGCPTRRTSSASGSRRGRTTCPASSGSPRRSAGPAPTSAPSSSAASATAARRSARRAPAHLPRREGARVRARPAAAAGGEGAALEAGADGGGARRGAAAALRRDDAGEARARDHLGREAEPVPGSSWARESRRARRRRAERVRVAEGVAATAGAQPTTCRRTSSSTTRRSRRSPAGGRGASPSWRPIPGVGPAKLERYGEEVLAALGRAVGRAGRSGRGAPEV